MIRVERLLQILLVLTVSLSGLLLGMGQSDLYPFAIAVAGAFSAFVLVDWLKWFRLPQWLANLVAVLVTIFSVLSFYFTGDSVRQLLGVGKLLVYLQTVLLFQEKSARVYWQVLVLSLLQIVVGAVFNLGFEGGVLFILYMLSAGLTMMVLHLYQDSRRVVDRNTQLRFRATATDANSKVQPIVLFTETCRDKSIVRRMMGHFSVLGIEALGFAIFLFYFLPRENSSWSGPREVAMQTTGVNKSMNLEHGDTITLSSNLVMTVNFRDPVNREPLQIREQPYLRGMALANLVIEGGRTTWKAPYDQTDASDYVSINNLPRGRYHVIQDVVLEPTNDPLLYTAMPGYRDQDADFAFCWPLGAITRELNSDKIQLTHFRYTLQVPTTPQGELLKAYPYPPRILTRATRFRPLTPSQEPGIYKWLTYVVADRYPTIERIAQQIADRAGPNRLQIIKEMERYLLDENRFTYTLDFRGIQRDRSIDPVEDFFANHRHGYCEYYASALTLMLRSQGIPARVVVGYRGGNLNEFGGHLDVEQRHGHAWVEAYLRPNDCSPEMRNRGEANALGDWYRLDPTPASDLNDGLLDGAEDALGLAKSLWRDYVLGLQADRGAGTVDKDGLKLAGFFRFLDLEWWQSSATNIGAALQDPESQWHYVRTIAPLLLFAVLIVGFEVYRRRKRKNSGKGSRQSRKRVTLRAQVGRLIQTVSPALGRWISGPDQEDFVEIPFYRRLTSILAEAGFQRAQTQTQREFAASVDQACEQDVTLRSLGPLTKTITDFYYLVRFGSRQLDHAQQAAVDHSLKELQDCLSSAAKSGAAPKPNAAVSNK